MGSISAYAADKLLDHVFGGPNFTPPATLYCALFLVLPQPDGTGGVEVSVSGYGRVAITNNTTSFPAASGGTQTTGVAITFASMASTVTGTVGAAWYDAVSGGNLIAMGPWANAVTRDITAGVTFTIDAGAEVASITGGTWAYYLANAMLDLLFGTTSFIRPSTLYAAAFLTMPALDGTGGVEPTVGSYARVTFTNDASHFPAASGGVKNNGLAISWPTASALQGSLLGAGWYDAATSGNLLMASRFTTPQLIDTGQTLAVLTNQFRASLL